MTAVAAVGGYFLAVFGVALLTVSVMPPQWSEGIWGIAASSGPVVLTALGLAALIVRSGRRRWRDVGWPPFRPSLSAFVGGTGLGMASAAVAVILAVVVGGSALHLTGEPPVAYVSRAAAVGVVLAVAALAEELLFRGYPLQRLAEVVGRPAAVATLAVLFSAVHLGNPDVSTLGLANIGLASVVMSVAFFTPGGLPAAWGVHFGWNAGLGIGADAAVSGIDFRLPLVQYAAGGPAWITGGAFGPEGGMAATVAFGVALIVLRRRLQRDQPDGENRGGAT